MILSLTHKLNQDIGKKNYYKYENVEKKSLSKGLLKRVLVIPGATVSGWFKNVPKNLKTLKLNPANAENAKSGFKAKQKPSLFDVPEDLQGKIKPVHIKLDLYAKLEALHSVIRKDRAEGTVKHEAILTSEHLAYLDFDKLYLDLLKFIIC